MGITTLIAIIVILIFAVVEAYVFFVEVSVFKKNKEFSNNLAKREDDAKYKMYEIEILNQLSDRIGYSLTVQNIIDVVMGSVADLVDYSAVAYMILLPEKTIFRSTVKKLVTQDFVSEVKSRMLDSLSDLLKKDFKNEKTEDNISGSILSGESEEKTPLGAFFGIPIMFGGEVAGLLMVADTKTIPYEEEKINTLHNIAAQASKAVDQLQEAVEMENSKLNAMVASMTDGIIMTDMDYKILVANPAAKKAAALENKKDLSVSDFMEGLGAKIDLRDRIEESIKLEKVFISEEISLPSGFFKIVISPVKSKWKMLGCVVILRDMTHEKEVQQIKDDFTSMIVHELRSPLDSIKKMIEMMRTSAIKKPQMTESLQMIYSSSADMLELVNNLLNVAKIEAGKFELVKQEADIKETIQSRILFFDIAAKDAKVKLESQIQKGLPDKVSFDPRTISQVLNNFISNAMKFNVENGSIVVQALLHKNGESIVKEGEDSGIKWFIKKEIADIPDSLFVAVTNTGIGIAPDQINKLFQKFFQVKSVFAQKGGTGLGLAISKSIVESHGGLIGVESTQGKGATFYFTLPIIKSEK